MNGVAPSMRRPCDVRVSPAKRTGTLEPLRDASGRAYFAGKIRLEDGSRTRVEIPEEKRYAEKTARRYLAWAQEQEDKLHTHYLAKLAGPAKREAAIAGAAGETCDAWYARYHAYQRDLGQTDADTKRTRWNKWIAPTIGPKAMALVTRSDVEDIRDALDVAIDAWKTSGGKSRGKKGRAVSGKAAMNVWSALTSSFKAATSSKRRDLRTLDGKPNPCHGVEPPGDRDSRKARRKTFLYPREAAALLACAEVPWDWREVYAIAFYTYVRPGELRVLTWADVNLDAMHLSITKAWDYQAKDDEPKIKAPKSRNGVRTVPIDVSLLPLLTRMKKDAGDDASALVVPLLSVFGEDHLVS